LRCNKEDDIILEKEIELEKERYLLQSFLTSNYRHSTATVLYDKCYYHFDDSREPEEKKIDSDKVNSFGFFKRILGAIYIKYSFYRPSNTNCTHKYLKCALNALKPSILECTSGRDIDENRNPLLYLLKKIYEYNDNSPHIKELEAKLPNIDSLNDVVSILYALLDAIKKEDWDIEWKYHKTTRDYSTTNNDLTYPNPYVYTNYLIIKINHPFGKQITPTKELRVNNERFDLQVCILSCYSSGDVDTKVLSNPDTTEITIDNFTELLLVIYKKNKS